MNTQNLNMMLSNIDWNGVMTYYLYLHGACWVALLILISVYNHLEFDFYGSEMLLIFSLLPFLGFILNIFGVFGLISMIKKSLRGSRFNN